jgi:hypothetical protein
LGFVAPVFRPAGVDLEVASSRHGGTQVVTLLGLLNGTVDEPEYGYSRKFVHIPFLTGFDQI